jgi:uncharacterized protein (TIGR02147 family)
MESIFNYLDYRKYLSHAIEERKRLNRHFSYRFISQHLKLKSSGFMNRVIKGQKKLPESLIPKIAELFKLDDKEKEYFMVMVKFNHSADSGEREELFRELDILNKKEAARHLQPEHYSAFTQWFYVAIREMLRIVKFKDDYRSLATSLHPKIKSKEARLAIDALEKTGLIEQDENGFYHPLDSQITTGKVWESELIKNFQIQFADLGKNAIITIPKQERDISNLTFCASEATMHRIAEEIASLRRKILALSDNDTSADTVYQCNMQLFPIGKKIGEPENG